MEPAKDADRTDRGSSGSSSSHLVAPRASREARTTHWLEWGPLPSALREEAVARLALVPPLVFGLCIAFGVLNVVAVRRQLQEVSARLYGGHPFFVLPLSLTVVVLVASAWVWVVARSPRADRRRALALGAGYQLLISLVLGVLHHMHSWQGFWVYTGWSYVALFTVVFAALVPATPGRVLVVSLAACLCDALGLALTVWAGAPLPGPSLLAMLLVPDLFAVGFAYAVSLIVHGLGRRLQEAERMGSYKLTRRLGQGGMGEVWEAEHHRLARPAAIKLIRPEALGTPGSSSTAPVARFEREAQATALLTSPHTIKVYDFGQDREGTLYYVMELLDGIDLERCVARFGAMPPARVVHLLRQACHSLAEAHARGLIHRDIKPANIYLCRQGLDHDFVKVLDFGLVKVAQGSDGGDARLTQEGKVSGTPSYLAPEMALGSDAVDGRADLYALGCVAYWLLAGRTVFEAPSAIGQVVAHSSQAPEPVSRHAAVPERLDAIVQRCLAKSPADRFPDARALEVALAEVQLAAPWTVDEARAWWQAHLSTDAEARSADVALAPTVPQV